ncbi:SDR family oxidoreductase [Vineibacter terrae]|uniref:SDR family oxidoreductase n=1 Tax=Vineibacter terrae TaxID=2586908 RepID=UPI002E37D8EB|nr:SDR family oxidoreductase [Vineibacter terrae]HEX2886300.1 SDR family oxidoreductase [Vineibacter terrae]
MTFRFDNRVALVTGAGAGLGRSHALLLASRGARIVVNDPGGSTDGKGGSNAVADKVVEEIKAAGGTAVANYDSVSDREGAARMVKTAIDTFGKLDIVINNAGILRDKTFAKMALDDFDEVIKVHLLGSVYVTKAAWQHMIDQKYGRVVLTTSGSGLAGNYGQSNYGAAKAAMVGLMHNLMMEGAKHDIKINCISPVAATRMTQGVMPEELLKRLAPEQISPAVAWLCAEQCDVTGEIVAAGAGWYSRIKLVKTKGAVLNVDKINTIEDFAAAKDRIFDMTGAAPYGKTLDDDVRKRIGIAV